MALLGLSILGCGKPPQEVRVDGSSTVEPLSARVAEELGQNSRVRVKVNTSGTGGGFEKFIAGEIDICDASRPAKQAEIEALAANGIEFVEFTVAIDGLAVVVNKQNDWVDCITVEQLEHIWRNDNPAQLWSDVDPSWPEEEIKLYGPDDSSGTFDYFTEVILGSRENNRSGYDQSEDDNQLVTGVSGDKYGLGYFGLAYFAHNSDKLKLLAVDGGDGCVSPTAETVASNEYKPLSRPLFIYVRKDSLANPDVAEFVRFYLEHAVQLAPEVGYVNIPEDVAAENQTRLEAALQGSGG